LSNILLPNSYKVPIQCSVFPVDLVCHNTTSAMSLNTVTDLLKALSYGSRRPTARQRLIKHIPTNTQEKCSLWVRYVLLAMQHAVNTCPLKRAWQQ
jgi:hypothetical protein